jgi:hypothetical protein
MAYSIDISRSLANQLAKFVTINRHQLAGQAANLDFWIGEFRHCLQVLDEYKSRFERMKSAQMKYATDHNTLEYDLERGCPCCTSSAASPPKRIDHREIAQTRQTLCEAMYRFLLRCRRESMINEQTFTRTLDNFGISIDSDDLRHPSQ